MGNREPVEDLPGSVRNPVPEMRDRHSPAADMVNRMKANPEILAEVLQHLQVTRRTAVIVADPPPGNRLQMIFSAFWAIASGGCSWAWFGLVVVFTTLKQIAKTEGEIPKEQRGKVEKWNRNLKEVEKNMNRVEQDVGNMKEAIERAAEDDFRISYINNKKLEMALVKAQSQFRSCQDDATDVREANSGLQRAAKDSARSARLVTGTTFAAAAALIALCCYNWTGSIMPNQSDDDVNTKMTTTSAMITGFLLMVMVTFSRLNAQNLFNNKKLLAECEKFQDEKLHLVDRALKVLKRDIELVADLKEKLDVMDITASRYASLRRPHWE